MLDSQKKKKKVTSNAYIFHQEPNPMETKDDSHSAVAICKGV